MYHSRRVNPSTRPGHKHETTPPLSTRTLYPATCCPLQGTWLYPLSCIRMRRCAKRRSALSPKGPGVTLYNLNRGIRRKTGTLTHLGPYTHLVPFHTGVYFRPVLQTTPPNLNLPIEIARRRTHRPWCPTEDLGTHRGFADTSKSTFSRHIPASGRTPGCVGQVTARAVLGHGGKRWE